MCQIQWGKKNQFHGFFFLLDIFHLLKFYFSNFSSDDDEEDSAMRNDQDTSILRDTIQNEPLVIDITNSPNFTHQNMEVKSISNGEFNH